MRALLGLLVLAGLAASSPAHATTGMVWKFPAEGLRYSVFARVNYPLMLRFTAEQNYEFRAADFQIELVTSCKPVVTNKASWDLECRFEDVALQATPVASDDNGHFQEVIDEMDQRLTASWVQIQFGADGRVKNLDLEGLPKSNARTDAMQEVMRLVMVRAFASLDLELPAKGDDKGKGSWKSTSLLANQVPSALGTMGAVAVVHTIGAAEGGVLEIKSEGRGVVSTGDMKAEGSIERPLGTWDITYTGMARFDTARGLLLEREYLVDGVASASSEVSYGSGGLPYVQAARIELLDPGEKPTLSATGYLPPR